MQQTKWGVRHGKKAREGGDTRRDSHTGRALGANILNVFRYVDDYLVLLKDVCAEDSAKLVNQVLGIFNSRGKGLKFTFELPEEEFLQFLDISIFFHEGQVC